jgi:hypothetical protein
VVATLKARIATLVQKPRKFPFVHKEAAIQYTVRYTELAPDRFKDFWRD